MSHTLNTIENHIKMSICNDLDRLGVHYRILSRVKDPTSLQVKIESKGEGHYTKNGKKVQDIIGIRIVTYFIDDVNLLWNFFLTRPNVVGRELDPTTVDSFKPMRKNMVCRMCDEDQQSFRELQEVDDRYILVDSTYEIQFRTTFSEGWHEVDHLLRYKCKEDWGGYTEEDRMLNGVFAALETNDRALKALFDDMAYNHYKASNWQGMIRMKFRLHFKNNEFALYHVINENRKLAKKIFRYDRSLLLNKIALSGLSLPITFDNIVYLIIYLEDLPDLKRYIPETITYKCQECDFS